MANKILKSERIVSVIGLVLSALAFIIAYMAFSNLIYEMQEDIKLIFYCTSFMLLLNIVFFILSFLKKPNLFVLNTFGTLLFSFSIPFIIVSGIVLYDSVNNFYSIYNLDLLIIVIASFIHVISYTIWLMRKTYSYAEIKAISKENRQNRLAQIEKIRQLTS